DRIANLEVLVKQDPNVDRPDPPALQQRHDMMRVKIAVYMEGQAAASRLMRKMQGTLAAQYGDAQSTYLFGNIAAALAKTNALIKAQPKNAYFQELRGDILMKANKPKEAADAYAKAVSLDSARSGLLPVSVGQALMAVGTPDSLKKAVVQINNGLGRDKENSAGYRYLAQAYGELGDIPGAELATAESHFYSGNYKDAKIFAMRAQQQMKRGEPRWLRAQDIINYKPSTKIK
ncbi:M48 family peptidase, partial [Mesorhizobium sp. M7A.F.Ca.CA.002.15.1.1]